MIARNEQVCDGLIAGLVISRQPEVSA